MGRYLVEKAGILIIVKRQLPTTAFVVSVVVSDRKECNEIAPIRNSFRFFPEPVSAVPSRAGWDCTSVGFIYLGC